jgi:uncharacterized metal-binding protein
MSTCAECKKKECQKSEVSNLSNCPTKDKDWLKSVKAEYEKEENIKISQLAAHIEKTGYCKWTRIEEIYHFAKQGKMNKIGIAFCVGLSNEARVVSRYFRTKGFDVVSAVCCCGALDKSVAKIAEDDKFNPFEEESMCNPIGQALLFNKLSTDLNVILGLCVGHDSLFMKYAKSLTTVLAVKDRVLGHNPLAAIYQSESYYKKKLFDEDTEWL